MPRNGNLVNASLRYLVMLLIAALTAHQSGAHLVRGPEPALTPLTVSRGLFGKTADGRMRWTLHCAAVAIEAFYGANGESYAGATLRSLKDFGFRAEPGVTVEILDATDRHYKLSARAVGGTYTSWVFDSSDAELKPGPR